MGKSASLVCEQLENLSREALEEYQDIIREFIRGRHGIYALYKNDRLYYVGLAINLRRRLKQHLGDRHSDSWDRFSVYLTVEGHHIKDLESLLLRIAKPKGNLQSGKFCQCENLRTSFAAAVRALQRDELYDILGASRGARANRIIRESAQDRLPVLAVYARRPTRLLGVHKGRKYRATVRKDGSIRFRGKTFRSPSLAGVAAVGHPINGWWFWQFEQKSGKWVRLRELRKPK
jgi:hypothetical protein